MRRRLSKLLGVLGIAVVLLAPLAIGCSSVGSSAVRTDGMMPQQHLGGVRLYAVIPPNNVRVLGVVEVHAVNDEANVTTLMPVFMRRVAELGGTGGVVDHVRTTFETRTEMRVESFAQPCGMRHSCWGSRIVPYVVTLRILSIEGRALVPEPAEATP